MQFSKEALQKLSVARLEERTRWPVEKRIQVVTTWLQTGNKRLSADICGVPVETVRAWAQEPWWKEMVSEVKDSRLSQTNTKLDKLIQKALDITMERLEKGDLRYNKKSGELERVELSALSANKIANDLIKSQDIIAKQQSGLKLGEETASVQDQLKFLAEQFQAFAKKQTKPIEDIEFKESTNAVHDEREAGLQEREREVQLPSGGREEAGGEEPSPSRNDEGWESTQGGWEGRGPHETSIEGWDEFDEQPEGYESESESQLLPEQGRLDEEPDI